MDSHLLDLEDVMIELQSHSNSSSRLEAYLRAIGVQFYLPGLVSNSCAKLVAVGGIPVKNLDMDMVAAQTKKFMGVVGKQSYLTYRPDSFEDLIVNHNHASCAHATTVSLIVAGISCAVENEFNSQRDLIHLGRITEARTNIQNNPPYVVLEEGLVDEFLELRRLIGKMREKHKALKKDGLEAVNLMHSKASATAIIVTGSLRNFQKLFSAINDDGKELEYKRALTHMRDVLKVYWAELFNE